MVYIGDWQIPLTGKIEYDDGFNSAENKLSGWPFFQTESLIKDCWTRDTNYKANYCTSGLVSRRVFQLIFKCVYI